MGLSVSQIRLLTLTERKADCEYGISIESMAKMALSREMSELSSKYNSMLQAKNVAYYHNGKYNQINYQYLMGYGTDFTQVWQNNKPLKEENNMILTDYNGRVVLNNDYAQAITSVVGNSILGSDGRGGTFSPDLIPQILATLCPGFKVEDIEAVLAETNVYSGFNADKSNTLTQTDTGEDIYVDNSAETTDKIKAVIDFYYPIFAASAANGWTTEYNKDIARNSDYVSDAITTGSFQLAMVNNAGDYNEGCSLSYFLISGHVQEFNDSDTREEITAWYNAEKERISEKETYHDIRINELSTELEAIKTEIQSVQSYIDDAIQSVFDWGTA